MILLLQDSAVDQEIRNLRMRYTRERDHRNRNTDPSNSLPFPYLPQSVQDEMARLFGRRNVSGICWLLVAVIVLLILRLVVGSPLALIGHLPADIRLQGSNWQFFAPIGSCILFSFLASWFARMIGPALQQPRPHFSESRQGSTTSSPQSGFQFHGSVVICVVQ